MTVIYGKNDSEELIKRGGMNKSPFVNPGNEDYNFTHRARGQTPMGEHGKGVREKHAFGDSIQAGSGQYQPQNQPMQAPNSYGQLYQPMQAPNSYGQPYQPMQAPNNSGQNNDRQPYAAGGVAKLRLGYPDTVGQLREGHINKHVD